MKPPWEYIRRRPLDCTIVGILLVVYAYLGAMYWRLDTLNVYDAAGQVAAVDHARSFWPDWQGWQGRELLGWAQGVLYPPAVHWVMAGLALAVGTNLAVRIVVTLALFALPVAMWWYVTQLKLLRAARWPLVGILTMVLLVLPDYLGGGVQSLFQLGLIPNFVALPLVFGSWGAMERLARQPTRTNVLLAGGLLGLLVWAHLVAAMVGAAYMATMAVVMLVKRQWRPLTRLIAAGTLGLVVSAPFWVSFVRMAGEGIASHGSIASLLGVNAGVALVTVVALVLLVRAGHEAAVVPGVVASGLAMVGLADSALTRWLGDSFVLAWLNAYRLQTFAFMLAVVIVVWGAVVLVRPAKWQRWLWRAAWLVPLTMLAAVAVKNPARFAYAQVELKPDMTVSGRFLEDFRRSESYPAPYTFQEKLLATQPEASWAYGLFIESAPNSAFVKSLSRSLRPEAYADDPPGKGPEDTTIAAERVPAMLDLFGIANVVSLNEDPIGSVGTWTRGGSRQYYHLRTLKEKVALAEVPAWPLRAVTGGWKSAVLDWWKENGPVRDLPYDAQAGELSSAELESATVTVQQWSDTAIDLRVEAERPVPVLVKTSYAPGWRATGAKGEALKIWRAAPSLILVQAAGEVHLRYR